MGFQTRPNKLCKRLNTFYKTTFYISGYYIDEPFVYEISNGTIWRINEKEGDLIYNATWNGQKAALSNLINSDPKLFVNYELMPLRDGIDFAEFLVDLTIKYERFRNDLQTCGGPIDILVLTKDSALWYKHKVFEP